MLREAFPDKKDIAALTNPRNLNLERFVRAAEAAAHTLGLGLVVVNAESDGELDNTFSTLLPRSVGALVVLGDPFFTARRKQLVALSARHSIPTMYFFAKFIEAGGLMSYGSRALPMLSPARHLCRPDSQGRQAGRPASSCSRPKFEFVINLKTAKALGLEIPPTLLARADEVIE